MDPSSGDRRAAGRDRRAAGRDRRSAAVDRRLEVREARGAEPPREVVLEELLAAAQAELRDARRTVDRLKAMLDRRSDTGHTPGRSSRTPQGRRR